MPYFCLKSNVDIAAQFPDALAILSTHIAKITGKPEAYTLVEIQHNTRMIFAGSEQPLAYCDLKSLGLQNTQTADISHQICTLLEQQFKLPAARTYIQFASPERPMWGWDHKTF